MTRFYRQVNPVELSSVSDVKQRHPEECDSLFAASAVISMSLRQVKFDRPITLTVPIPPGPNSKTKRPKTAVPNSNTSQPKAELRPKSSMFAVSSNKEGKHNYNEYIYISGINVKV